MLITNNYDKPKRADVLLSEANPSYSRAALAKLFDMGHIIGKSKILKPGDKIQPNFSFQADISPINKPAETLYLQILYEDENVIVIDKPIGVISHARGRYCDEASVASFVSEKVRDLSGERAGLVHSLDRATSGVMICAKNQQTLSFLQKQFSSRNVKKSYIAVVLGELKHKEATIDVPIARNPRNPKTFQADENGKSAITNYQILKGNTNYSLVELKPLTGRTHQLRVHLAYIGHPIIGDAVYNGQNADRMYLHAHSLEITLPGGVRKTFVSKLPVEFNNILYHEQRSIT